ncbi:MAG: hypothetical protein RLZZ505_2911 [Verrucomicrobiota bacterium]|jgi:hypothetical protein
MASADEIAVEPQIAVCWEYPEDFIEEPIIIVCPGIDDVPMDVSIDPVIIEENREGTFVEEEIFTEEETLVEEEIFTEEETLVEEETFTEEETLVEEETFTEEETLAEEETFTEEETLAEEETYTEEETLAEEETFNEEETLAEEETFTEEETLAEEETYTEEETLAEEEAYTEEETLAEEETFTEEEVTNGEVFEVIEGGEEVGPEIVDYKDFVIPFDWIRRGGGDYPQIYYSVTNFGGPAEFNNPSMELPGGMNVNSVTSFGGPAVTPTTVLNGPETSPIARQIGPDSRATAIEGKASPAAFKSNRDKKGPVALVKEGRVFLR